MNRIDWSKSANRYKAAAAFFAFLVIVFELDSYLARRQAPPAEPAVSEYAIYVNDRLPTPAWTPVRAYVENGNTVIEFENSQETKSAPVLFASDSKPIQYTVEGNRYRVKEIITRDAYLVGPSDRPGMSSQVLIQPQRDWQIR